MSYLEFSLTDAIKYFPFLSKLLDDLHISVYDENYIVRFNGYSLEIGYKTDSFSISC